MSRLNITASSRTGCVGTNNKDMILVGEQLPRNGKMSDSLYTHYRDRLLVAVADGLGGINGQEVAISEWLKSINNTLNSKGQALTSTLF